MKEWILVAVTLAILGTVAYFAFKPEPEPPVVLNWTPQGF